MSQSNKKSILKDEIPIHQVQTETEEKDRKDKQEETEVGNLSFDEDQKDNNSTPDGPAPRGMDA